MMWSLKSGCMLVLLTPLSRPVSATVTMTPLPSNPDQDASMLAMLELSQVSSTFITSMPTELRNSKNGRGSTHSTASCCTNQERPLAVTAMVANRPVWESKAMSLR